MLGNISIELEGLTPRDIERCRQIIDTLFVKRVFFIRNGSATLRFDNDSTLQEITYETRWRRDKPDNAIADSLTSVKITSLQPQPVGESVL